ncbi:protein-tyrosine phosphatase-like protein [Neohortaea acidophila]|uniref:Protein-tyrosine phosphatase-like protein n=1 Tax=Neohortaea acidophila TaxID=245834 RepID=A0A6A6PI28_9PEZI|nr:protein-tyrosine phosphatase-like protein [Neohortaea acidophila]KAF2479575.1 protein-tyrosine phosphatase-like protein [Neohortaea acidophila]
MASSDTYFLAHPTSTSSYAIPAPPRIVVPPPALTHDNRPDIPLTSIVPSALDSIFDLRNLLQYNPVFEWTYERRRDAQLILPYLYLGPMTAAKDEEWLKREGITAILAVRQKGAFESKLMNSALRKAEALGLQFQALDVAGHAELIQLFPQTTQWIHQHVTSVYEQYQAMGKVLVFCESGNERSAGVVAAYLMETHVDVDYIKAMQFVQAQRFCVNFDDGMKRLLQGYWDILCARRAVAASAAAAEQNGEGGEDVMSGVVQNGQSRGKRALEHDGEGDEMVDGDDTADMARFDGRSFAPFVDLEF